MKCQPLNFKGNEGVVSLTRWIEKMESIFHISGCAIENQVKFATSTLLGAALTWWNDNIYEDVKSSKPKMLDETIELATRLWIRNSAPMQKGRLTTKERLMIHPETTMESTTTLQETECRQEVLATLMLLMLRGTIRQFPRGIVVLNVELQDISREIAQEYMAKGCQIFLAQISAKKEEDKSEGKQLKDVPIVQDFPKVFPRLAGFLRPTSGNSNIDLIH
ncbi:hypothetical protein Tco_0546144 [Tanacetum coccineum]